MKSKIVLLNTVEQEKPQKIPLNKCREILNKNGLNYTDEEVEKIRDFLYHLAQVGVEEMENKQSRTKVISLSKHKLNNDEESHYLRTG